MTFRHTWASWAVMSGVRLEEVQRMGGWATAQMVQSYAHLSSEHLAEAAARIKPISLRYNSPKRGKKDTKIPTTGA
jgi:integrase